MVTSQRQGLQGMAATARDTATIKVSRIASPVIPWADPCALKKPYGKDDNTDADHQEGEDFAELVSASAAEESPHPEPEKGRWRFFPSPYSLPVPVIDSLSSFRRQR